MCEGESGDGNTAEGVDVTIEVVRESLGRSPRSTEINNRISQLFESKYLKLGN